MYTFERFAAEIQAALLATGLIAEAEIELAAPKAANVQADLALPCFRAAKSRGVNPAQLANQIVAALHLAPDTLMAGAEVSGPYVNFHLNRAAFVAAVLDDVSSAGSAYGHSQHGAGKTVVAEYSSPNVAKRMHVGHIRSTIIGLAVANLYASLGYQVIRDNHLGDYGKQFGVMIAAIVRFGRPQAEGEEALAALEKLYQRYNLLMKPDSLDPTADPETEAELDDDARAWSLRLEQDDPQAMELWKWMVDMTIAANQANYARLGAHFTTQHGESFYKNMVTAVMNKALEAGLAERDQGGALVVKGLRDSKSKELPTFLLQRSDGATLYLTRDVATVLYREATYQPDIVMYFVEQRQELHFRQTFTLARALEYTAATLVHIPFGTISDAQGQPLSTRKGNMVYLQALLDDAHQRAKALIEQKVAEGKTDLQPAEIEQIAEMVGVGSVIYNDLYQDPKRNITLDWERMLAFEGNSAPYLQYMHARCCSILREAGELPAVYAGNLLVHEAEFGLLKSIAQLPAIVREAAERFAPFVVADWLYATARAFSAFYDACSVLKAETPDLRAARLQLVAQSAQALRNGLALLSIKAPERM